MTKKDDAVALLEPLIRFLQFICRTFEKMRLLIYFWLAVIAFVEAVQLASEIGPHETSAPKTNKTNSVSGMT